MPRYAAVLFEEHMARKVAVLFGDGMMPAAALFLVDVRHGVRRLHRGTVRWTFGAVVIVRRLSGAGRGRCDGNRFVVPAGGWKTEKRFISGCLAAFGWELGSVH